MKAQIYNLHGWTSETNPETLYQQYKPILLESGFKILHETEHHFQPFGYTALFLLSESHFAIHTFPEENKTYIELSSCVESQYKAFEERIKSDKKLLDIWRFIV